MRKIISFLDNYYQKAIQLSKDFSITRDYEWTPLLILNELSVQIGHIYNIIYQSDAVNEKDRTFTNLGDELSDIFLQLITLIDSLKININDIRNLKSIKEDSWLSIPILFGQLNEAIMEKYGYRFNKPRKGFSNIDDFIKNRILRLLDITYQIAEKYHLDMEKEFELMLLDANAFLEKYKKSHEKKEFIDTYNENHQFIGKFERQQAHQMGLWHDVFGCLIFNPVTNEIFFQLKNHKYNGKNKTNLLEITSGGHLQSGEKIEDGIREVKEETGLEVKLEDMIYSGTRKCDRDNNMIIREFQHFYLLPLNNISIEDFQSKDDEVIGFVKIDIDNALKVINNNITTMGTLNINGTMKEIEISKNLFDQAFLTNGVLLKLIKQAQEYTKNKEGYYMKLNKDITKKFNKISNVIKIDKFLHNEMYCFDNGQTEDIVDIKKENLKYSIIKLNTALGTRDYLVFVIITNNDKQATHQLMKSFHNSKTETNQYFKKLCTYIEKNSNEVIINKCFDELSDFPRKNFLTKILGI